ncbi:hypothetical protein DM02DRAFT_674913 [Periconia macrospinosa]|uniref:Oxidoreductase acuF-like C2H2 type zinc-finger domain-containing protein n=1 Tax=Periconia macrospinosa TaxID=97972 RepID=A0A2V1DDZ5_9PLEO|nr:hypothetical protein DM02DRAFT_674913 [Periconia macrospinosa]
MEPTIDILPRVPPLCRTVSRAFRDLYHHVQKNEYVLTEHTTLSIVDSSYRFKLWVKSQGLSSHSHGSFHRRTADFEDVIAAMQKVLNDISGCLVEALDVFNSTQFINLSKGSHRDSISQPQSQLGVDEVLGIIDTEAADNSSQSDIDSDTMTDPLSLLDEIVTDLAIMLKRLYRIATRLNNQSASTQSGASWKYKAVDHETGVDLLDVMVSYDERHLSERYPQMRGFLVRRLASANGARRRRFAYWRRHHDKLVKGPEVERETADLTQARVSTVATILKPSRSLLDETLPDQDESVNVVMADDDIDELRFPDLPGAALTGAVFECPYCFQILGSMTPKRWRDHIVDDLLPHMCTYEDCSQPGNLYHRRRDWAAHEARHGRNTGYQCPEHAGPVFLSQDQYEVHLYQNHSQAVAAFGMQELIKKSEIELVSEVRACPVCGEEDQHMVRHISRHLVAIALFALPRGGVGDDDDTWFGSDRAMSEGRLSDMSSLSFEDPGPSINEAPPAEEQLDEL